MKLGHPVWLPRQQSAYRSVCSSPDPGNRPNVITDRGHVLPVFRFWFIVQQAQECNVMLTGKDPKRMVNTDPGPLVQRPWKGGGQHENVHEPFWSIIPRRLLKNPCLVSGSISKQFKEREGGDAVSASSTPSDAELRREIGPFKSLYIALNPNV
jgi:hypothetical protein